MVTPAVKSTSGGVGLRRSQIEPQKEDLKDELSRRMSVSHVPTEPSAHVAKPLAAVGEIPGSDISHNVTPRESSVIFTCSLTKNCKPIRVHPCISLVH